MDQTTYPGPPTLFHIRMNALFTILWGIDLVMFGVAAESTLSNGVGGMVLFASEVSLSLAVQFDDILKLHQVCYSHGQRAKFNGSLYSLDC